MKNNHSGACGITLNDEVIFVSGDLRFSTVMGLNTKAKAIIKNRAQLNFDLSRVTSSDSAGLALLIEWVKFAKRHRQAIELRHIPKNLMQIAKASGLDHLLSDSA